MNPGKEGRTVRRAAPTVTIVHDTLTEMWACERCCDEFDTPWTMRGSSTAEDMVAWWGTQHPEVTVRTLERLRGRWVNVDGPTVYDDGPCEVCAADEAGPRHPIALIIGRAR